jgi:uncharacterized circularly permuted ATP-grasp superfamily protein
MKSQDEVRYDEMFRPDGTVRPAYAEFFDWYEKQDAAWLRRKDKEAEVVFRRSGITFCPSSEHLAQIAA